MYGVIRQQKSERENSGEILPVTQAQDNYKNVMDALKEAEGQLPVFSSSYDEEIRGLFDRIMNRKEFSYRASEDPLYGAYRDRYVREGRLAMRDTMGQAAALTGGYGSSYSESVGQQQFESYLQRLNDVLPELYADAYERYKDEGDELLTRYRLTADAAETEYDRHRDNLNDAKFGLEMQNRLDEQSYDRQQDAYSKLYQLIYKTGYDASDAELAQAGMSRAQANALKNEYIRQSMESDMYGLSSLFGGSYGGSGGYGSGSYGSGGYTEKENVKLDSDTADDRPRR